MRAAWTCQQEKKETMTETIIQSHNSRWSTVGGISSCSMLKSSLVFPQPPSTCSSSFTLLPTVRMHGTGQPVTWWICTQNRLRGKKNTWVQLVTFSGLRIHEWSFWLYNLYLHYCYHCSMDWYGRILTVKVKLARPEYSCWKSPHEQNLAVPWQLKVEHQSLHGEINS